MVGANRGFSLIDSVANTAPALLEAAPGGVGKPPKLAARGTGLLGTPLWPLARLAFRCCAVAIRSAALVATGSL